MIKYYLVAYNVVSMALWTIVLLTTLPKEWVQIPGFTAQQKTAVSLDYVRVVQSLAVLEVFHALFRWVKSPVSSTVIQVSSRLFIVWAVLYLYAQRLFGGARLNVLPPQKMIQPFLGGSGAWSASLSNLSGSAANEFNMSFYVMMVVAWCLTEIVRYAYYALSLLNSESYIVTWLRYTLFFVLYPIGAGSEAMLLYRSLPFVQNQWQKYAYVVVLCTYPAGFIMLYSYMIKQRRKQLSPGGASKRKVVPLNVSKSSPRKGTKKAQ
ncbi:hypothetical protein MP228_007905 [Amoeboaphelidium protococcarum]|nr:hypothetical protein MP228_007905 [Amoeboaphelidium protococcarum]